MAIWDSEKPTKNGWYIVRNKDKSNPLFSGRRYLIYIDGDTVMDCFAHSLNKLSDEGWDKQEFNGPLDLE